jgi:hypothetical protein
MSKYFWFGEYLAEQILAPQDTLCSMELGHLNEILNDSLLCFTDSPVLKTQ